MLSTGRNKETNRNFVFTQAIAAASALRLSRLFSATNKWKWTAIARIFCYRSVATILGVFF